MTSFPTPCPCPKHMGQAVELVMVGPGEWVCPDSLINVCTNLSQQAKAKNDIAKAIRTSKKEVKK